jgi:beta-lactamase class A
VILALALIFKVLSVESASINAKLDPPFDCAANSPVPQSFIDNWTAEHNPGSFNVTVIDLVEGCTYAMGDAAADFPTASTGKVMVAIRALEMVDAGTLNYTEIASDLDLMITESNNESANRLFLAIDENTGIQSVIERYSLSSTFVGRTWGTIHTNSNDQALLLDQALGTKVSPFPEAQRAVLRDLMIRVKPEQAWGAGSAGGIPALWSAAVKNGWYLSEEGDQPPIGLWRINTIGYVWDKEKSPRWIFTGYSNTWPTQDEGEFAWSAITKQLSATLGIR